MSNESIIIALEDTDIILSVDETAQVAVSISTLDEGLIAGAELICRDTPSGVVQAVLELGSSLTYLQE